MSWDEVAEQEEPEPAAGEVEQPDDDENEVEAHGSWGGAGRPDA